MAGVLEPPDVGGGGDAIFVVAVDADECARTVGDRNNARAFILYREPPGRAANAFIPSDQFIGTRAPDVAPLHRVDRALVIKLGGDPVTVIEEARRY